MVDGYLACNWRAGRARVIRLRHVPLPRGLSALVRRDDSGALEVFLSQALPPDRQRSAVRVALRSARQAGWRSRLAPGLLIPVPLLPVPLAARSLVRAWLRAAGTTLRAHALATAGAATAGLAVATGAVLIAVVPHQHGPASAGRPPVPGRVLAPAPSPAAVSPQPSASARTPAAEPVADAIRRRRFGLSGAARRLGLPVSLATAAQTS